jgi:catechol 2,3-dioxygenase-like lactoylglutathione lyase family enzyme
VLGSCDLVAFVSTADAARAREFYAGTLGLALVDETPFALVFDAHGTRLRVTVVERVVPAPYTVLGWAVDDIAQTARSLARRGVQLLRYPALEQDELGVWRSPAGGARRLVRGPRGQHALAHAAPLGPIPEGRRRGWQGGLS